MKTLLRFLYPTIRRMLESLIDQYYFGVLEPLNIVRSRCLQVLVVFKAPMVRDSWNGVRCVPGIS
jgi:hypothetical protein